MSLRVVPSPIPHDVTAAALAAARDAQLAVAGPALPAEAFLATGQAERNLATLLGGGALTVTTGQQAGLFAGPLYVVEKALTAAALAQRLTEAWGTPVVPVFWVAGDDHDFAEIASCAVMGQAGEPVRVVLRERPAAAPMHPAFRELLGGDVAPALERLEGALPASEFRGGVLEWLRAAYRPDASMADAFAQAVAALMGEHGVVVLRGWHPAAKRAVDAVFRGALERAGELDGLLAAEAEALRASGREAPVGVGDGLALVMVEGKAGRDRLRILDAGAFETRRGGERFAAGELAGVLRDDAERLSANVLLRPVVESALVRSVAYVGGPGELSYLPQARPLFAALGVPRPVPVPRSSGVLVDARTEKTLTRLGLTVDDLAASEQQVASRVLRDALPPSATAALEAARRSVTESFAALSSEAGAIDATLARPVEAARNQALAATNDLEKRLVAALKRSSETAVQQVVRARAAVRPGGEPQERVYALASFSARYGPEVVALLSSAAREHAATLLEGTPRGA